MLNPKDVNERPLAAAPISPTKEKEIQAWIVARLAQELEISPREIDIKAPFYRYGLDSLAAVHLVSNLEAGPGRELSSTLPYDCPSVEALPGHASGVANATR